MKVLLTSLLFSLSLLAQAQTFVASTNAREVVSGGSFTITYKIETSSATNFEPPVFAPFRVLSGPSQSRSTTIINGRRSSSVSVSYSLLAPDPGTYTLMGARITAGNRTLTSNSLQIKVVKGSDISNEENIFVKLELDQDSLHVGQQTVLSLKLYHTVSVDRFDILDMPEFKDIYAKDLPRYTRQASLEVVNGIQYQTQVLRRMALFPQKSGTYELDGILVRLGIPTDNRRGSGFFFSTQLKTRDMATNGVSFVVTPLPDPKPEDFSGGVGNYSVENKIDRTRLSTDDALTLTMTVKGDGDQRLLLPPQLDLGKDFDAYDANIVQTDDRPGEDRNRFVKVFEYLIIPKRAGRLKLNPHFTYFNSDSSNYITIRKDTFELEVKQGTSESKALDRFNQRRDLEISPNLYEWRVENPSITLVTSWWYWIIWLIGSLGFCGLLWARKNQLNLASMDPTLLKFKRANKVAEQRLKKAKEFMDQGQNKTFFEEIALAVKQYLGDKLHVDPSRFSRQTISAELENLNVSSEQKANIIQLLNDCDLAIFASSYAPDMEDVYRKAIDAVSSLEDVFSSQK